MFKILEHLPYAPLLQYFWPALSYNWSWKQIFGHSRVAVLHRFYCICTINPLPHRDAFANRADPDQAALVRATWSGSTLFAYGSMIRYDPTLVDLTSNFFFYVQTWKFIYIIIYSGRSLAWIFMKEKVNTKSSYAGSLIFFKETDWHFWLKKVSDIGHFLPKALTLRMQGNLSCFCCCLLLFFFKN